MANTQKYLNHLLQNTGITPACSEEERAAGESLADIFKKHGFEPEVQEFTASNGSKIAQEVLGIMTFAGTVLMGIGEALGVVGVILVVWRRPVLFAMERSGGKVISSARRWSSPERDRLPEPPCPLASPRNRPVVVVAHYDSPRADLLAQAPYAAYRPLIMKLLPFAMLAPAIIALIRMMPLPAVRRRSYGSSPFWPPSPSRCPSPSSPTSSCCPIRAARSATSRPWRRCSASWTPSPRIRGPASSPTTFRSRSSWLRSSVSQLRRRQPPSWTPPLIRRIPMALPASGSSPRSMTNSHPIYPMLRWTSRPTPSPRPPHSLRTRRAPFLSRLPTRRARCPSLPRVSRRMLPLRSIWVRP